MNRQPPELEGRASARPRPRGSATLHAVSIAAALVLAAAQPTTAARAADLPARLATALGHRGLQGATVGALVVAAEDGQVLFDRDGSRALVPASNLKILTALAVLSAFGPTHRFTTTVLADAPPDADGAVGTLAVRGGGDPALTSEEWWRLAADLGKRGLRRVRGALIVDDSYFDGERWNTAWNGVSSRAFHAPVGALTANYGAFSVEVEGRGTAPPRIAIDPAVPFFTVTDRTSPGSGQLDVNRESTPAGDRVIVRGAPPGNGETASVVRSVSDPSRYAAAVLRMQLAAQGIAVEGPDRAGAVPAGFVQLLSFKGKPLSEIVGLLMKYSNNNIAEMLVKDLGAAESGPPGTWASGLAAVRARLLALGLPPGGFSMVDGSGLSPANRVSPRALVDALRIARASFAFGPEFESALPIAARDGTLRTRAAGAAGRLRAKTGLLNGAATLSGYALRPDGSVAVFSLLVNDFKRGDPDAMAAIDAFAATLVE